MTKKISNSYSNRLREVYVFDKLSSIDDIKEVLVLLIKKGFKIDNIEVNELADYDEGSLVRGYDLSEINNISIDFANKTIQDYTLSGQYQNNDFFASINPSHNSMMIDYVNVHQKEIEEMMQELDEKQKQDNNINDNTYQL